MQLLDASPTGARPMKPSFERLWNSANLALWSEAAYFATLLATASVFEAARYLHSVGAPLSIARAILLGV